MIMHVFMACMLPFKLSHTTYLIHLSPKEAISIPSWWNSEDLGLRSALCCGLIVPTTIPVFKLIRLLFILDSSISSGKKELIRFSTPGEPAKKTRRCIRRGETTQVLLRLRPAVMASLSIEKDITVSYKWRQNLLRSCFTTSVDVKTLSFVFFDSHFKGV